MKADLSSPTQAGNRVIADHAKRQLQTFFDEIKNRTRNYRTVASLDAQVAQEYRGRCILELLQNAHDALAEPEPNDPRRVSFVLNTGPKPVLLVGNTGRPFHHDDFKGICQLAQSPKDPNKSVGNKGLGFRSVLEVCGVPEIWSTTPAGGDMCFSFRFDPKVIARVKVAARDLERQGLDVRSPFDANSPLVDWSDGQLREFRQFVAEQDIDVPSEAMSLSPYQLPLQVEATPPDVQRLLDVGHATVVRLRLDGEDAVESVRKQLDDLRDARSVIFLDHLAELAIEVDDDQRSLKRTVCSDVHLADDQWIRQRRLRVQEVGTSPDTAGLHDIRVWTRVVGGDNDPSGAERLGSAVAHLPNRWPEVRQATVGIAVEDTPHQPEGVFVIFLPTEKATGTGAHVNAPFFGSLDRRQIDFDKPYNALILDAVLHLCLDVITELTRQDASWCARAVLDIVASVTSVGGEQWQLMSKLLESAAERGKPLDDQAIILCDGGWRTPQEARLMPDIGDDDPVGAGRWRERAAFPIVSEVLDGRRKAVTQLLREFRTSVSPKVQEWIDTVERIAKEVSKDELDVTWDGFLRSLLGVLPGRLLEEPRPAFADPLAKARFLPTSDGSLIAASGPSKLFFRPVQGADIAGLPNDLPRNLKGRLAFLHPDVQIHEGPTGRNTKVQKFLDRRFAKTYRNEDLLRDVVIPALPSPPIQHGSEEAVICAETLAWTSKLVGDEPPETLLPLLKRLLVCRYDGWFPLHGSVFGTGWSGQHGDDIRALLAELPVAAARELTRTMLLPPTDDRWLFDVSGLNELFVRAGVLDGLWPRGSVRYNEEGRRSTNGLTFQMSEYSNNILEQLPSTSTPSEAWTDWYSAVKERMQPDYVGLHEYELSGLSMLPEIHHLAVLKRRGRRALSNLLLQLIGRWNENFESVAIRKRYGQPWETRVTSPLKHWLQYIPWLVDRDKEAQPLSQRWFVPESLLRGQSGRYAHLDPLSLDLAKRITIEPTLRDGLASLGLNVYPTEDDRTGPELLNALAGAWQSGRVPPERFDVFLGQVREAWRFLDSDRGLPHAFLVRTGRRSFSVRGHGGLTDVFLPDNLDRSRALGEHARGILEMEPRVASRLTGTLVEETRINLASQLDEQHMIDGSHWTPDAAKTTTLDAVGYEWLPVVLLSVAAHGGTNPAGATTQAWRDAADRLRRTRVIECEEIVTKIVHNNDIIAESQPVSQWLPGEVLAVRRDLESLGDLALAGQAILNRQDLSKDLRLVLRSLSLKDAVTRRDIEAALDNAEIDAQALADIYERWVGDMSIVVDRVRPVLRLFQISEHGFEAATRDADSLTEWLSSNLSRWDAPEMLLAARRSHDDHAMGMAAWQALGEVAQLPKWNEALAELSGKYETVENANVSEQVAAHLDEVGADLRAFARHVATTASDPALFRSVEEETKGFESEPSWSKQWWDVPFSAVINSLTTRYKQVPALAPHVELIEGSDSADRLRARLQKWGITITPDPYEMADANQRRLDELLSDLRDIRQAWAESSAASVAGGQVAEPKVELDGSEYLESWSDTKLLEVALQALNDQAFKDACGGCSTLDAIRPHLDLTPQAIEARREERLRRERQAERQRQTHDVAGHPFEIGASYRDLFDRLGGLATPAGPHASKGELTTLMKMKASKRKSGDHSARSREGKSPPVRRSSAFTDLVGVVGEIWAFRYLRSEFGETVVTRKCWVSEIRRSVLPPVEDEPHDISDSHGFDFQFTDRRGRKWHVEVKATAGDDLSFDLGISEIQAATQLARARRGRWRILRVRNALSDQPEVDWLPNPFEDEFKDRFRLQEAGMRVSYRVDSRA